MFAGFSKRSTALLVTVLAGWLVSVSCASQTENSPATPPTPPPPGPGAAATLVGAGDIADCLSDGDEQTAALLDQIPGTVFTAGDNAYEDGTMLEYLLCYEPTWGRHKLRTRPVAGNHEYESLAAIPYFDYFGAVAGLRDEGWYSFDLAGWHIVVLNSNCDEVGGCEAGSPQERWLRADLAANSAACTAAIWHHPRFSSGFHGDDNRTAAFWDALYEAGAEVIITGHDHNYERFAPQTPEGESNANGIRQFVVGTGGRRLRAFESPVANSEVRNNNSWGVLKLTLRQNAYDWEFIPVAGATFSDAGSGTCR